MISIIIPIYNSEKYIDKCVKSVLNQTYKDFELLIIDDGSNDNSAQICDEFAASDSRIRVIHKKNEGVSVARNTGIELARGEYITFIDSDDYYEKDFLINAITKIENVDMYISSLVMDTYENNKVINSVLYGQKESTIMTIKELFQNLEVTYPQMCICGPCCKLYKTSIIKLNNIFFDKTIDLGEDTLFNINYFKVIGKIYFDQNVYYHYRRINGESLFTKYHPDIYEKHVKVYNEMRALLIYKGCDSESITRFEDLYLGLMIGCIHHIFRFSEKKEEKVEIINNVINNKYIKFSSSKQRIKKQFIINCIKKKRKRMLYYFFSLRYLREKYK